MKKLLLITACLFAFLAINAQSLENIVKNYTAANKMDKIAGLKTIKITAKMSMMGMDMPMEMWMKNPDKIKTVTSFSGQNIIASFDGEKGWQVNPMSGSTEPQEMTAELAKQTQNNNMFVNKMKDYLSKGQLTLSGEESVNGKPSFKIKVTADGGISTTMYIDKSSYLLVKSTTEVNQGGTPMTVESFPSDYKEIGGILLPMKTTTSAAGQEIVLTFTNVEVDIPMDDSIFKLK